MPIVIKVGSLCLIHLEVTSISYVLLSLGLNMLAFAQDLTYIIHDCIE